VLGGDGVGVVPMTFYRVNSHRAGAKLQRLIGVPQYYVPMFTLERNGKRVAHCYVCEIPDDKVGAALGIKGVSRTRFKRNELLMCWQ
jgi:hypothetical protein